jgi:hypothetical protein
MSERFVWKRATAAAMRTAKKRRPSVAVRTAIDA